MKYALFIPIFLFLFSCRLDPESPKHGSKMKTPEEFLYPEGRSAPAITLVGTFHFAYPDADVHKTDSKKRVDVLSPERQKEMDELRDHIARFNPNKIVLESKDPVRVNELYKEFLSGELEPKRDERVQLGFALARRFQLDTIYCLDATSFAQQYGDSLCPGLETVFKDYDWQSDDPLEAKFFEYLEYRDEMIHEMTLLEFFKEINSEIAWNFNYGSYLIGDFRLPDFQGADALATYWYSRNLRTFRKIQMITESPEDRILVLFGNGHVAILDQLLKCSPEYKYISFGEL